MTNKDKELLGARIQDLIHDAQVDPQKLLELARQRVDKAATGAAAESASLPQEGQPGISDALQELDSYALISLLGRGGTGQVYKARDVRHNEIFAIKILSPQHLSNEQRLLRFYMEAKAAASLQHPNIVHIHKVAEERGHHYMVMDYVDGIELSELVVNKALSPDTAARIMMVIADVMDYVHRQGILHRDLKPSNIMIDTNGKLWLTDFGVAKLQTASPTSVTTTGMLLGTPSYMPPEQVGGNSDELGPTCDIYALGAVLYELLTTEPPFQGETPYDTLQKVLKKPPRPPRQINPNIPKDLEAICLKCLEKDPQKRYSSARELALELKSFLTGGPVQAVSNSGMSFRQVLSSAPFPVSPCDPDVFERWGRILRWHALLWFTLCLASQLLIWGSVDNHTSLTLLWGLGSGAILAIFLGYRFYRFTPLTPLERQAFGLLLVFVIACGAFLGIQMFMPTMPIQVSQWKQLLPFLLFLAAIAFGCMCVVVDGSFAFLAVAFLGLPLVHVYLPEHFFLALGLALAIGFFFPGQRFSQAA